MEVPGPCEVVPFGIGNRKRQWAHHTPFPKQQWAILSDLILSIQCMLLELKWCSLESAFHSRVKVYGHGFAEIHSIAGTHGSFLGELSFEHSLAVAKVMTSRVTLKAAFRSGDSCAAPDEMGRRLEKTPRFSASALVCKP